jgi:hypothetical protein
MERYALVALVLLTLSTAPLLASDTPPPAASKAENTVSLPSEQEPEEVHHPSTPQPTAMPNFKAGAARWYPPETRPGKWEWVELNTGEWIKGTIDGIRNDKMDFDSDKFDDLHLKMQDVVQTRSSRTNTFVFTDQRVVIGIGQITPTEVIIESEGKELHFPRDQLVSSVVGDRNELKLWSGKVGLGVSSSSGNTNQMTANLQASLRRRGAFLRAEAIYYGNFGQTNGTTNVDNQQVMLQADLFIRDRFFLIPISFDYYRDPFSNIELRVKPGAGFGYQIKQQADLEWEVTTAGIYQHVDFDSPDVPSFDSFAVLLATNARWEITSDITLDSSYSITLPTSKSSNIDQQAIIKLEIDVTKYITLSTTLNWTRIGDPMPLGNGTLPEKDDLLLSFGMDLNF